MTGKTWTALAALGVAMIGVGATAMAAGAPVASAGVYSKAQAQRGAEAYAANCARCHGPAMEGLDVAPELKGPRFLANWYNQPVSELAKRIRTTMPLDMPGALGAGTSVDITADILAANGYPAGDSDLPTSNSELSALVIDLPR